MPGRAVIRQDSLNCCMRKTLVRLLLLLAGINLFQARSFGFGFWESVRTDEKFSNSVSVVSGSVAEKAALTWASSSVLASGTWVKVKVEGQGIFKISFSDLKSWGFADPSKVSVFGNGGYMLSKLVDDPLTDDLAQNPVLFAKGASNEDCLFFYAPGTVKWTWNPAADAFTHQGNDYSNVSYYYLTDRFTPLTVQKRTAESGQATDQVNQYLYYQLYEVDAENLIASGRRWFGDRFQPGQSRNYSFSIPTPAAGRRLNGYVEGAGRSSASSSIAVKSGANALGSLVFGSVDTGDAIGQYANTGQSRFYLANPSSSLNFTLTYNASASSSLAWLDFFELNGYCTLSMSGGAMSFRYPGSVGAGKISRFTLSDTNTGLRIWEVSDFLNPAEIELESSGTSTVFTAKTETLREFVAFYPAGNLPSVTRVGTVANQDLHQMDVPQMLIISPAGFRTQADELAAFHLAHDGFRVTVVDPEQIYNEFSSGMPDAAGIRNFLRCCRERASSALSYVLLFGDGSYDNKNLLGEGVNFIPTYQSENSLLPTASFVTDDFFVLLEAGEGEYNGTLDLGIGRIPARTADEAQVVVDKIKSYVAPESLGEWRNVFCFIADDEDENTHQSQADRIATTVGTTVPALAVSKIYFDSYKQQSSPSGDRYPDVTTAISSRVKEGALVLNYTGHANQNALAAEKVLTLNDIDGWTNYDRLPVFVTATCEFSRFDASTQSGGEHILFNPNGGGIALFSTTRVVYSNPNFVLNNEFYNQLFQRDASGKYQRMGDVMKLTKNAVATGINKRNFMLLGDPALRLTLPQYRVVTTSINGNDPSGMNTPAGALDQVTVKGEVVDLAGSRLTDFNGDLIPVVYDKATSVKTLGNGGETPFGYSVQNNRIYKGLCSVINGQFEFTFVVPKDINYAVGNGKIQYYTDNGSIDAHGANTDFRVGGNSGNSSTDTEGPEVELYLNNPSFRSGDEVGENSILYLNLSDASGINTVGIGIGHDITAVLDGDNTNVIVLNDYYLADQDSYTSGTVVYPLSGLSVGEHTLTVKVWDVVNNSTEITVHFVVTSDFRIEEVVCYPNPASDYTRFKLIHNRPDAILDARIEIYDMKGSLIDQLSEKLYSSGAETPPVVWQISESQFLVRSGSYLYRVVVKASDGAAASRSGVIVILRK